MQVKIRHDPRDLENDIALKLRVANGTHTAAAHAMALLSMVNTEALCSASPASEVIVSYLDSLYQTQILPAATADGISSAETNTTWEDWRKRLMHPHFGLSTFFITQNGAAKCGIRLGPTIKSLVAASVQDRGACNPLNASMVFAVAAILRFLTPISEVDKSASSLSEQIEDARQRSIYTGWLDGKSDNYPSTVTYADGLRYNLSEGWYEFRCNCLVSLETQKESLTSTSSDQENCTTTLPEALARMDGQQQNVIRSYLLHPQGGNLHSVLEGNDESSRRKQVDDFVCAVHSLYLRMAIRNNMFLLLKEMAEKQTSTRIMD